MLLSLKKSVDTPIAELGFTGTVGSAMNGNRPGA
jgi:pyruvate/2-oxoglutarate/acetoin dehydrogenase E1 component